MKRFLLAVLLSFLPAVASAAVGISSIAVTTSTVTVTTAASHGLAIGNSFCLTTPADVCGVVRTVPSGTQFTFDQPPTSVQANVAACASSCGTGDVAPNVVVLGTTQSGLRQNIVFVRWLTTLTPVVNLQAGSVWKSGIVPGSAGATAAMTRALQAGVFVEQVDSMSLPPVSAVTLEAIFQADWVAAQNSFVGGTQPGQYYGFTWNTVSNVWVQK